MKRDEVLRILSGWEDELRQRYGLRSLGLFGSMARDEAGQDSDVDLLVDFDASPGFDGYMGLKYHLEERLGGQVDLVMIGGLKPGARPVVEQQAMDCSNSWLLFLQDMEQASEKVLRYTEGLDLAAFTGQEMAFDAVLRNLEIIGQAAKGIPLHIRDRYQDVDWRGTAGLRDILAHAYIGLDDETLWDIVKNKVPALLTQIRHIREEKQ